MMRAIGVFLWFVAVSATVSLVAAKISGAIPCSWLVAFSPLLAMVGLHLVALAIAVSVMRVALGPGRRIP